MRAVTDEKPLFVIFNYESKSKFGAERLMYPISAGFPFRFVHQNEHIFITKLRQESMTSYRYPPRNSTCIRRLITFSKSLW